MADTGKQKKQNAGIKRYLFLGIALFVGVFGAFVLLTAYDVSYGEIYILMLTLLLPPMVVLLIVIQKQQESVREYKAQKEVEAQYRYALELLVDERVRLEEAISEALSEIESAGDADTAAEGAKLLKRLDSAKSISLADAVIGAKRAVCQDNGIVFDVCTNGAVNGLDSIETVSLFGNILDNAIEACREFGARQPYIRGNIIAAANLLSIDIINSKNRAAIIRKDDIRTTKKDAENHGYGLKQIAAIVRRHNGDISIEDNITEFHLKIKMELSA